MLVKVKLGDAQKFVKITELSLEEFLTAGKKKKNIYILPLHSFFYFYLFMLLDECLVILHETIYSHMLLVP